jgi:hypothetical protein
MKDNDSDKLLIALGIPVLYGLIGSFLFIVMIPIALFQSWIVQKMYDWFLLPIKGFPHLNLWHVWGIVLLISVLSNYVTTTEDDSTKKALIKVFGRMIGLLIILVIGYFIKGHIGV